jgi:hypothetical protein
MKEKAEHLGITDFISPNPKTFEWMAVMSVEVTETGNTDVTAMGPDGVEQQLLLGHGYEFHLYVGKATLAPGWTNASQLAINKLVALKKKDAEQNASA